MDLMRRLHDACAQRAAQARVTDLTIGLGYTAVSVEGGGLGLAYTWFGDKACCSFMRGWDEAEGAPATDLLGRLLSADGFERSIGLATVNALNQATASRLPVDEGPAGALVRGLRIERGTKVAMVGFFPPVAKALEDLGVELKVIDTALGIGDQQTFKERLGDWADALIMTATALLNDTAEELLERAGSEVRVALLGPTTPLVPEAFAHLSVDVLAGMVPGDAERVLRAVRHGAGTPELQRFSRKVYWERGSAAPQRAR
jgi:uncharacterized protein (DUF4213/DUF364 family)